MNRVKRWLGNYQILLIAAPIILFAQVIFAGKALYWGTASLQFIPWRVLAYEQLSAGVWAPLWNPYNGMGAPLLANYQLAWFYPPSWILGLFYWAGSTPGLAWGYSLLVVLHIIAAGWGMAKLARRLGLNPFAQTVSGLAFGLCGYIIARGSFFSMVWAYAWLPWMIDQACKIASPIKSYETRLYPFIPPGLVFVITMQLLAGHAQIAWYSLMITGFWLLYSGWVNGRIKGVGRALIRFGLTGLAAVCLSAVQLLPTVEYLMQSQRSSSYAYQAAMTYSFWPWRFLTLIAPDFFGNPGRGDYWGYVAFWEDAIYIGVLPLFLAISTVIKSKKQRSDTKYTGLTRFVWGIIITAFIFGLGENTPIFPFLFKNVPTFDMFQAPARYLIWAVWGLSLLAGIGAHDWRRPAGKAMRWLKMGAAASTALMVGAIAGYFLLGNIIDKTSIVAVGLFGFWAMGAAVLGLKAPWRDNDPKYSNSWGWYVAAWIVLDLVTAGLWLNPVIDAGYYANTRRKNDYGGRVYITHDDEYLLKFVKFLNFNDLRAKDNWHQSRDELLPNLNILDQISITGNFDPLLPKRYSDWMERIEYLSPETRNKLLPIMGVSTIEKYRSYQGLGVDFIKIGDAQRVFWYSCAETVDDPNDALVKTIQKYLSDDPVSRNDCVVLEGTKIDNPIHKDRAAEYVVSDFEDSYHWIEFNVRSDIDGWLVLSDLWYPYWNARIDGQKAEVYPANFLFKGIKLPAGSHHVLFEYQPLPFIAGAVISIISWLLFVVIIFLPNFSRGRNHGK